MGFNKQASRCMTTAANDPLGLLGLHIVTQFQINGYIYLEQILSEFAPDSHSVFRDFGALQISYLPTYLNTFNTITAAAFSQTAQHSVSCSREVGIAEGQSRKKRDGLLVCSGRRVPPPPQRERCAELVSC